MLLTLSTSACSLCEDTDVSLSEADTKRYIRFIQNELETDSNWINSKSFRVCLLCTHSLHLLMELLTGIEDRNVKSCFCCKSSSNIFKQSDLPKDHKANVASFAFAFNLRGLNICLHCFYAINFWVKLKSFLESSKQKNNPKSHSKAVSGEKNGTYSPISRKSIENSCDFKLPRNVNKFPEIKKQVKKIKMLQNKMNRVTLKRFSSDKKLVKQVPFVYLTRISETDDSDEPIHISDESDVAENYTPKKFRSKRKASARVSKTTVIAKKKSGILQNLTPVGSILYSTDSDDENTVAVATRNFRNRPPKVITPLKNKYSPNKKKNTSKNGVVKTALTKKNKSPLKNSTVAKSTESIQTSNSSDASNEWIDSDNNDYSVTRSESDTGIVIKRISRSKKAAQSAKSQKLSSSPLRTIRIQTKKASTSTSSDNTDISPTTSAPRSPVTLPPKKNRKRIMDLSDTDYFESKVNESKEKRFTRAIKSSKNNRKRLAKDIEEVIIDSSDNGTSQHHRQTRSGGNKNGRKALLDRSMEEDMEKDPLEIISPGEDSETDRESTQNNGSSMSNGEDNVKHSEVSPVKEKSPGRPKRQSKSAKDASKSNIKVDDNIQTTKINKRTFKRLLYREDNSEDSLLNETPEDKDEPCNTIVEKSPIHDEDENRGLNDLGNNKNKENTTIDQIVSKYVDETSNDNISIETQSNNTIDLIRSQTQEDTMPTPSSVDGENEVLNSMRAIHGTEEINFDSSLTSPPVANDTLELLASISDETPKEGNMENQLNLQLTSEAEMNATAKGTQSTLLMTDDTEEDIFNADTPLLTEVHEDVEVAITKASSESSIYQDAEEASNVVTVLTDISFTSDGECKSGVVKDVIEETLISMELNVDNVSLIYEDDSNVDKGGLAKRKRNFDDSVESGTLENDETPRTKRVRFAAEKKILNEDDSVCLEDFEDNEEHKETLSRKHEEHIETENFAEVVDTEEVCSLDI